MGISLAFHIVFAAVGVALPVLMVIADMRTGGRATPSTCCSRSSWRRGRASCSRWAPCRGPCCRSSWACCGRASWASSATRSGCPFALEGFAFFTEAIFLGIYLYGRGKVSPRLHLVSGIAVAVSGAASAFFVTLVNAFMNGPGGTRSDRRDVQPVVAVPGRARAAVLLPGDRVGDGRASPRSSCCATRRGRCTARRWRSRCRWPA